MLQARQSCWKMVDRCCQIAKVPFLLIANFSGFLGTEKHLEEVEEQLGEVFRWARAIMIQLQFGLSRQ